MSFALQLPFQLRRTPLSSSVKKFFLLAFGVVCRTSNPNGRVSRIVPWNDSLNSTVMSIVDGSTGQSRVAALLLIVNECDDATFTDVEIDRVP